MFDFVFGIIAFCFSLVGMALGLALALVQMSLHLALGALGLGFRLVGL